MPSSKIEEREHELKCWPEYYDAVERGEKTFEYRKNDRGYQVGNLLLLRRYDPHTKQYTGAQLRRRVTYILEDSWKHAPLADEYCVLALSMPGRETLPENIERAIRMARHEVEIGNGEEEEQVIVYLADRLAALPPETGS